jgi:hypothetical protein
MRKLKDFFLKVNRKKAGLKAAVNKLKANSDLVHACLENAQK